MARPVGDILNRLLRDLMRCRKKISISILITASLMLVIGVGAYLYHQARMKNILLDLGQIRLRMTRRWEFDRPREFLIFDHRQRIRESGFDAVWRDDRYLLKDMRTGEEVDLFRMRLVDRFDPRKRINQDKYLRELMWTSVDFGARMPKDLFADIYGHQLEGFHLVVEHSSKVGGKYLFVRDVRENDIIIALEKLMLLDAAISYNCAGESEGFEQSVATLKDMGFIMKKKGDGYFPTNLETGEMPEFPARELFIHDALRRINEHAKKYGEVDLRTRRIPMHIGSNEGSLARPYYVDRVLLELYGFAIRWDKARKQYEMVRFSKP